MKNKQDWFILNFSLTWQMSSDIFAFHRICHASFKLSIKTVNFFADVAEMKVLLIGDNIALLKQRAE
jgi:hypothetical protein